MRSLATLVVILGVPLMAKTYSVDGIVVAVDAASRTMLVSHRAIAHYMPAMLMPFRAENCGGTWCRCIPGARIAFDLAVTKGQSVARNIRPTGAPDVAIPAAPGKTRHRCGASRLPTDRPARAHASRPPICAAKSWPSISSIRAARCRTCARAFPRTSPCLQRQFRRSGRRQSLAAFGDGGSRVRHPGRAR